MLHTAYGLFDLTLVPPHTSRTLSLPPDTATPTNCEDTSTLPISAYFTAIPWPSIRPVPVARVLHTKAAAPAAIGAAMDVPAIWHNVDGVSAFLQAGWVTERFVDDLPFHDGMFQEHARALRRTIPDCATNAATCMANIPNCMKKILKCITRLTNFPKCIARFHDKNIGLEVHATW